MRKRTKSATRFPLLVYRRLFRMWFWPSTALCTVSGVLVAGNPPALSGVRHWFLVLASVAAGLMVYSLLARFAAHVRVHPESLRVRCPFYRLAVSYGRINVVRTTQFKSQFPPGSLSWSQRRLVGKLYGRPCIIAELTAYPLSRRWLSLLVNRFLLSTRVEGLVFLVDDWLQLSNEIEGARTNWLTSRYASREQRAVERILRG